MVLALLGVVFAAGGSKQPATAGERPRYSLRRVYGERPGPRMVIVAIPRVTWRDLRGAETPNLRKLSETGAVALMQMRDQGTGSWVSLGAGRPAVGQHGEDSFPFVSGGRVQADMGRWVYQNEAEHTKATVGLLGSRLHEFGLTTAVVDRKGRLETQSPGAAIVMDELGRVDDSFVISPPTREGFQQAVRRALSGSDVVVVDLGDVLSAESRYAARPSDAYDWVMPHAMADGIVGDVVRALQSYDALLLVVVPESPHYENDTTMKSMGPVILYETRHPRRGLLYTDLTRWPGVITASDFAPTVLDWWQIPVETPSAEMDGHVLTVRPGTAADIDRLDRELTDHFRWSFVAIPAEMGFGALLIVAALYARSRRRAWLPYLKAPALALPVVPAGYLVAHRVGVGSLWSLLVIGFGAALLVGYAAGRMRSTAAALAVSMLGGAGVIGLDTLLGNWTTRLSAFGPPPLIGARYYGIGNEHMGFLVGLAVIGLAGLWEWRAWRWPVVIGLAVAVTLLVSMPFWGANWGGGVTAAVTFLLLWLFAGPRRWRRDLPIAAGLLLAAAMVPGLVDLLVSPSAGQRTHLGQAMAAFFSGQHAMVGDIAARKLRATFYILFYTPWTLVLGAAAGYAFWTLLKPGGSVQRVLRDRPKLRAGIWAALIGGAVSSVVNDSGVAAGAGLWCAAFAATVFAASRAEVEVETEGATR